MGKKIYRIVNPVTGEYISEVHGMMRYEEYDGVNRAYVYDLADATFITKQAKEMNKAIRKSGQIPEKLKEKIAQDPIIVPINIDDVRISLEEAERAIDSAPVLGLTGREAIRYARWQRVRMYKQYLHYNTQTPSHRYIYAHGVF